MFVLHDTLHTHNLSFTCAAVRSWLSYYPVLRTAAHAKDRSHLCFKKLKRGCRRCGGGDDGRRRLAAAAHVLAVREFRVREGWSEYHCRKLVARPKGDQSLAANGLTRSLRVVVRVTRARARALGVWAVQRAADRKRVDAALRGARRPLQGAH